MRKNRKAAMIHGPGRLAGLLVAAGLLAGCSGGMPSISEYLTGSSTDAVSPGMEKVDDTKPIAELYNAGLKALREREYRTAVKKFAEVERQHPYSKWATKAILMQAYAQYQRNKYDEAIAAAKRFITLHPGHKDAPYAYYLIALSDYERINDVKRDPTSARKALAALEEVARRYPDTPYARDARRKAVLARDHLAGKEMEVGRYYLERKNYLAAINRFKTVVKDYQTSTQTPEALYRLVEAYLALGVRSEAQTAAAVLGYNFPKSQWYKDAYSLLNDQGLSPSENKGSWISRAFRNLL